MQILGRHLVAELSRCDAAILDDLPRLRGIMIESARRSGATVVDSVFHRYNPQGISGVIVIAESHISIHTWPEYSYAAVDCFTCGSSVDPDKTLEYLRVELGCQHLTVRDLKRGIPSESNEIIAHKSVPEMLSEPIMSAAAGRWQE
jgi:S-adenosylmethionine decarboxylase